MSATATVNNPFFARVWTYLSAHETEWLHDRRRENLAGLTGRVLEVGAGTGTNFAFYPATVTQVVGVEPEPRLREAAERAAAAAPVPVTVRAGTAEDLPAGYPFDAVVCSLMLCSVADPDAVLRRLADQVRPGGQLRYFEHVASPGPRGGLQRAVDATFWPRLFGNCHTHRDTEASIVAAGFVAADSRRGHQFPRWAPVPVSEFVLGRAVKPA